MNIEENNNKVCIVVIEIFYQVNKVRLVEKIVELVCDKKIDGIMDFWDEFDCNGMCIVIEFCRDVNLGVVLNNLYKYIVMQLIFGINMFVIVNKELKILNLCEVLYYYLQYQIEVICRCI